MANLQRQHEDHQIMEARFLMQQRQAEASLLAAAMATSSNNMLSSGMYSPPGAFLYQQALMNRQGAMLPAGGATYGGLVRPNMAGVPPSMAAASKTSGSDSAPKKKKTDKKSKPDHMNSSRHKPYFDASTCPDPLTEEEDSDDDSDINKDDKVSRARQNEAFPKKLYRMLEDANKNGNEDIISFFPHGRAFGIHKPRKFITDIM